MRAGPGTPGADPVAFLGRGPARAHQGLPRARRALVLPCRRRRGRLRAHRARGGRGGVEWLIVEQDEPSGHRDRGRAPLARSRHHDARGGRVKVGVIGCGVISRAYVENASGVRLLRDRRLRRSRPRSRPTALGKASGLAVVSVDELIADPDDRRHPQPDAAARARRGHDAGARGRQARLHREAARHRRGRGHGAGLRGRAPRAAHRLRARHLPRLGLPGRSQRRSTRARSASRSRSARRCSSAARRPGIRTPTSSTPTAPGRCSTWARTT